MNAFQKRGDFGAVGRMKFEVVRVVGQGPGGTKPVFTGSVATSFGVGIDQRRTDHAQCPKVRQP